MFIGHYALGFAAKRAAPTVSLGALFAACQFADLLWPTLVLLGVEHVEVVPGITKVTPLDFSFYPYSHGLLAIVVWGALFGIGYRALRHSGRKAAITLGALVMSHWALDFATHRPDLPLVYGEPRVGLGLWNSFAGTVAIEGGLFVAGVAVYLRATRARDRTGTIALWGMIAFLVLAHVANLAGPPPPSGQAVAWSAQALWLLVAWGWWVDRHRAPRPHARAAEAAA